MNRFLLIKMRDHTRDGRPISAENAALALLDAGFWPLWSRTPNKDLVAPFDEVAIYLGGPDGATLVLASATIIDKRPWDREHAAIYPLALSGVPDQVLHLGGIVHVAPPVRVKDLVEQLELIGSNKRKWGMSVSGGMRHISDHDFRLLTRGEEIA